MKHHFPRKLLSIRNLKGGQYGTLDVTARDRNDIEVALGGDFVTLTRAHWIALRKAIDPLFGTEIEIVVATDADGEPLVFEERLEEEEEAPSAPPRRTSRRRSA